MLNAHYITVGPRGAIEAVFPEDARRGRVEALMRQLSSRLSLRNDGAVLKVFKAVLTETREQVFVLAMECGAVSRAMVQILREVTQPRRPYLIEKGTVYLTPCLCGHPEFGAKLHFFDGLEPEDENDFVRECTARFETQVTADKVRQAIADETLLAFTADIRSVFHDYGAHVRDITLKRMPSPNVCTHA